MENQKYFDLHCHPTTKSFLTGSNGKTPWDTLGGGLPLIKSQSNFSQLFDGKVKLAVLTVIPIELGFTQYWLIDNVVDFLTALDGELIDKINRGMISYNKLFWDEITHLKGHLSNGNNKSVKLLKHIGDFDPAENVLNGIMGIEGSHFLFNRVDQQCSIMANLRKAKTMDDFSFLHMNLTHLTWNSICNHAYGDKMIGFDIFKPHLETKGISELGKEIINECYSTEEGKRILIDVKHMSLYARKQFYEYRQTLSYAPPPILATHIGVTGFSWDDIATHVEKTEIDGDYTVITYNKVPGIGAQSSGTDDEDKGNKKTYFNPWSINLYDEDIREIVASDGLMGINLDQRILGAAKISEEYIRTDEYELALDGQTPAPVGDTVDDEDESDEKRINERKHLRHLCNTLLYIFKAGAKTADGGLDMGNGKKAWEHVCIGSDFDGLIDEVNNCKSAAEFPKLESDLRSELGVMMQEDDYEYPEIILEDFVRDLMYNNARSFLDKYFTWEYLTGED